MSDYKDPRLDQPMRDDEIRSRRLGELNSSNAMWGWIAGAVALAVVLVFIFARGPGSDTASNVPTSPPTATTGMAPKSPAPSTTQAPRPAQSTTGQSNPAQK